MQQILKQLQTIRRRGDIMDVEEIKWILEELTKPRFDGDLGWDDE